MPSLFADADLLVRERHPFVICTVVDTEHSAPRGGGARMLVRRDGSIVGTIGGGPLEATVISEAITLLAETAVSTRLFEATLTTEGDVNLGMKCGGRVRVLLDAHRPAQRAVIFGAGHVGLAVAGVAQIAGWDTLVLDDRPDRLAMVPAGLPVRRFESDDVASAITGVGDGDFVVILTRCHELDEQVLAAALGTRARYIGLIGSKRKVAILFRNLREKGLRDPSDDARVYAPIGLDFGGKEPGEIAVAVLAELMAVRDGRPLAHRKLPSKTAIREARNVESDPARL